MKTEEKEQMNLNKHIWEDIPNYKGLYKINQKGEIINAQRDKPLNPYISKKGYLNTKLSKNNKKRTYGVHQLMAMTFLNHIPCKMKLVINHINLNKLDNRLENLEIITNRENTTKTHLKSSSKYTGVSFNKINQKWFSSISIKGKTKYLGIFINEEDAYKAYLIELNNLKNE